MRISVLGCGRIGEMHAKNIAQHDQAHLGFVFDADTKLAETVAAKYNTRATASSEELIESPETDAILIAAPTFLHVDLIEQGVAAGKAVLCEKPIDLNLARVDACAEKIAGHDTLIQLGFNRRFDPGHRAARDAVVAGEIGDLHQVIVTSRDPGLPPEAYLEGSGGMFKDMTIHDFDIARYMLNGDEVATVYAAGSAKVDPDMMRRVGDIDTGMILMTTKAGCQVHINNSRSAAYGYDQRIELFGSKGMLISGNRKEHELTRYSGAATETAAPYQNFFIERYQASFHAEISAFVRAFETNGAPEASFDDGRMALVLAEAALLSMREGRVVTPQEIK
ncbi:inositol 2-dehydrogenase [Phaeobacter italicus]|uniref:inositol 2-dehydrogenase n=1 Tax=Phaeobacter italicus TaxID=481446 RepID=UPI001ADB0EB3|nr:inositol 2-dehydrogenase [Phaeobacter italicus]MBO9443885.1 inositol 2-dehydrogenase [Phaeobacter italicus]